MQFERQDERSNIPASGCVVVKGVLSTRCAWVCPVRWAGRGGEGVRTGRRPCGSTMVYSASTVGRASWLRPGSDRAGGRVPTDGATCLGGSDHIPDGIDSGLPDVSLAHATTDASRV